MNSSLLGRFGEAKASEYLEKLGYKTIGAGYRCRFGEIDLIVKKGTLVAFVEVKLRKNSSFAAAYEAVTLSKQNKLKMTAANWLAENNDNTETRFDVVEVYTDTGQINFIPNAFE